MPRHLVPLLLVLFAGSLLPGKAPEPDRDPAQWAQWRGPTGQGYVTDDRVPLSWSESENVLWKTRLPGNGNSTPIVWGDRIFLTSAGKEGASRQVLCVRAGDGKILWQQTAAENLPREKTHTWNGYASSSCATDGKHVWAFFGTPGLFCFDIDGKLVWKKTLGTFNSVWGSAASPFLYENLVIVNCDNDGGAGAAPQALIAFDKATGETRWTTPRNQGRGFSTPRLMKVEGGRVDLVLNGPLGTWGYDPATGKERWRCTRGGSEQAKFGEPIPVDDGQRMFIASGRPGPYQIVKMPGMGDVTKTHVLYSAVRKGHRDVSSPIIWQGQVYAVDRGGILSCYDLATGKETHTETIGNRKNRSLASPIAVRGKLLWLLDDGVTVVVEPGAKPKIVGRNKLSGESLDYGASPAVAAGRLYIRSQTYLYCIGEKKAGK